MKTRKLILFRLGRTIALLGLFALWGAPVFADLVPQPNNKRSSLVDNNRQGIRDNEFAAMIKSLLIKNGQNNTRDAKFLFQQCFGGGMLDNIQAALGNTVKWVGGSAARHDEVAHAFAGGTFAIGYWTQALAPEMNKDQTLLTGIDNANKAIKPVKETGQSISANNGSTITLKDPGAASHHAILWGGQADSGAHTTNIERIRQALINQWGPTGQNVTITTLFRDGQKDFKGDKLPAEWNAKAATKANLQQAFTDLAGKMNPNEQFLFYSTGHGSLTTALLDAPKQIPGQTVDVEFFDLFPGELEGMAFQLDNEPMLSLSYSELIDPAGVYFNNSFLGTLDPGFSFREFLVPEYLIGLQNEVRIDNFSGHDFLLEGKEFYTGAIDLVIVPEPGSFLLFTVGIIGLGFKLRPRRRQGVP